MPFLKSAQKRLYETRTGRAKRPRIRDARAARTYSSLILAMRAQLAEAVWPMAGPRRAATAPRQEMRSYAERVRRAERVMSAISSSDVVQVRLSFKNSKQQQQH